MRHPIRLGRYEITGILGHGGMGAVYKARDPVLDRSVAVKLIGPIMAVAGSDDEALERFRREARAAGKLSHPNIVSVYDMGVDESTDSPYIVMEHVDGVTLATVLNENPMMPVPQALDIIEHVGAALVEAHEHGIIHRDIKPANVFLDARGRVKVGDFGIARVQDSNLTQTGLALGTPGFLAPELMRGAPADARSDVFALGVLAYQLLAGKRPFDGPTPAAITLDVVQRVPEPPRVLRPEVPAHVSAAVMRAIDKSPERRTPSVEAFLQALADRPTVVPPPTVALTSSRGISAGALLAAGLAGALIFGLAAFLLLAGRAPEPKDEVAAPAKKTTAAPMLDEAALPTRKPTASRTLPPVESQRADADAEWEREPELDPEPDPEPTRRSTPRGDETRRRVEDAVGGWARDRLGDILDGGRGDERSDESRRESQKRADERAREDEKKREEREREERKKEREREREGRKK